MKKYFSILFALIAVTVQSQSLYFIDYDFLGKNDKVVTNVTFEGLATTTQLNNAIASKVPTNRTITIGSQVGSLQSNLVFEAASGGATLAESYSNGNFVGTERITPLAVESERFGITAGDNTTGLRNYSFGYQAGRNVIGTNTTSIGSGAGNLVYGRNWTAVGGVSADHANGNDWTAVGGYSGNFANGNLWCAFGYRSGSLTTWSNSVAVGNYAGYYVQGKGLMCIDTYTSTPPYTLNFGTNDAIFISDGITHIGRTGSKTNASANVLRGIWELDGSKVATQNDIESRVEKSDGTATNLSVSGTLNLNGEQVISAAGVTNVAISLQQLENYYTKAEIDAASSSPYKAWTGTITPANGTATVTYAHGNMPRLMITSPTVITLDPTGYGTSGVSRVSLSLYSGTNAVTFNTNLITFATAPTISTNCWNTILFRRAANCIWKGVGL